jgi:creatinine amidohydrolase/Fe(II)-dependent formamide hydrolase-like protein
VSIDTETFQAVMRRVAQSALAAGFGNVFLMGDHVGGQPDALRAAAQDLEEGDYKLDATAHVSHTGARQDVYRLEDRRRRESDPRATGAEEVLSAAGAPEDETSSGAFRILVPLPAPTLGTQQ